MEWLPSTWEDIRKYYSETYTKIPDTGDQLWFVKEVIPTSVLMRSTQPEQEECLLELHEDQPYVVEMVLPHKSTFQCGEYAYFMERVPAQQYRRGISSSNCKLFRLKEAGVYAPINISDGVLNAYVDKQAFLPINAVHKYNSIALHPRWSLAKTGALFVDCIQAGTINFEHKTYSVPAILRPEFEKILKTHGEYGTYRLQ